MSHKKADGEQVDDQEVVKGNERDPYNEVIRGKRSDARLCRGRLGQQGPFSVGIQALVRVKTGLQRTGKF
jgi:hypothetical protein